MRCLLDLTRKNDCLPAANGSTTCCFLRLKSFQLLRVFLSPLYIESINTFPPLNICNKFENQKTKLIRHRKENLNEDVESSLQRLINRLVDQYTIYLNKHHLNDTATISRQYLLFLLSRNKSLLIQTNLESHQHGPTRILSQSVSVQCFPLKPEQPKSISQTQGIRVVELNSTVCH